MSVFTLIDQRAAKADPALIASDESHFDAIAHSLTLTIADLSGRLEVARKDRGDTGEQAWARDQEVHRLTARLRTLRRFGVDLCLGHLVTASDGNGGGGGERTYIGRLGLADATGKRLLLDWRSPAAEPFFGATHANPMGLASRRRYRWTAGQVTDYWDEVFSPDGLVDHAAALDDQSSFIASLGSSRSPQMRDVLGTIAADQDAIIRAGSPGTLVVDGGPGTGKTVVALHRAAYLMYADPRLGEGHGGVLFVGPHQPYLNYVADVLPGLGEDGVQTCTVRGLVPEGATAGVESDPRVARLKDAAQMVGAIEPAVALYESPPTEAVTVSTPWTDLVLRPADWAEAFAAAEPAAPHNGARDQIWRALVEILVDRLRDVVDQTEMAYETTDHDESAGDGDTADLDEPAGDDEQFDAYGRGGPDADDQLRASLEEHDELAIAFGRVWPVLEPTDIVGDLWSVPAYLRRCAPWLDREDVSRLQRADPQAWTVSDLPLLDAARARVGDPETTRRRQRQESGGAAERRRMADVVDQLMASDDSEMRVMSMLRGQDLRAALVDGAALPSTDLDVLAGPFSHIVVDEAQELTDAQWQMVVRRCPSRSFTVVGDRAQARHGFTESWQDRLRRTGIDRVAIRSLGINYRTPQEVMAQAEPVIRAALPDANVPTSVRQSGIPVRRGQVTDMASVLGGWLAENSDGIACVIGDPTFEPVERVSSLTPETAKGLEFDLVVLVDPDGFGAGIEGAVDRYVAMTRATQSLVVLTSA